MPVELQNDPVSYVVHNWRYLEMWSIL